MTRQKYVDYYISQYKSGQITLNEDRIKLISYIENVIYPLQDIHFNEDEIDDCISFIEKWYFPLEPFQKFLIPFIFLYHHDGTTVFDEFFWSMARGAGKNGLISGLSNYFISPLCGIPEYNVAIAATVEKQAKTSFMEVHNMLKRNPELDHRNGGFFKNGLAQILCTDTLSTLEYLTSNARSKDSFRHGCLIFDEVHEYENFTIIEALTSGLGKIRHPRVFYISTNGFVREGVYDKKLTDARDILERQEYTTGLFPWICTLDDPAEVHDESLWEKANPMFHKPMGTYAKGLYTEVKKQWIKVQQGEMDKPKWLTKRMNIADVELETSVATREDIQNCNEELPDLTNCECIGGLDYASIKDFASVGLLFKKEDTFYWMSHSFVRKGFLDNQQLMISPMIPQWQDEGLLTVVDEPTIDVRYIRNWFEKKREQYGIEMIVADTYRQDLVRPALEDAGFELEFIRRSTGVQAGIAPMIEVLFAKGQLKWGINPLMNWFTNNVLVKRDADGNMYYSKKDEFKRKTDGFIAFTHAFFKAKDELTEPGDFFYGDWFG